MSAFFSLAATRKNTAVWNDHNFFVFLGTETGVLRGFASDRDTQFPHTASQNMIVSSKTGTFNVVVSCY